MSYPDSVRYLYSLGNELKAGAKFGLERMQVLLAALGNPETGQRFVHVAGTNGKGSTCAMLDSILRTAGIATGLYTSPHLIAPTERIQINGGEMAAEEFAAVFERVHEAAEQLLKEERMDAHPSYFETVTAMALIAFRAQTEAAVIEVGLGGRLDATNVIQPELCVITPVSWDHENFLGNSLESIASEKAGILKPGVPLVLGRQGSAAEEVILSRARDLDCRVLRMVDVPVKVVESDERHSVFALDGEEYECPLAGTHQIDNAATAVLAAREWKVPASAIAEGLRKSRWPGRLEWFARAPDFVLDGAHNPAGAAALAAYIEQYLRKRPVWLVYGAMRDKAIEEVTERLFPLASKLIVTMPDFPRALRPEAILAITGHRQAVSTETIGAAIEIASTAPRDAVVFFTGSLYLVGEARKLLLAQRGRFVE